MARKHKKGFISFIALILAVIVGYFCINFMSLSNMNTIGIFVKKNLDKSTLAAISCVRYNKEDAEAYILIEDAVTEFSYLAGKNFGLKTGITMTPFREYNGKFILYKTTESLKIQNNRTMLAYTPNILFGVFNYEDLVGKSKAENDLIPEDDKINEYRLLIKAIINETSFVVGAEQNLIIKETILKNLFPEDYNSLAPVVIKTTKPITIALADIPIQNSAFNVNHLYRFSLGRLNIYNCQHIYTSDCASFCFKCGKGRTADVSHTSEFICSRNCSVCKEKIGGYQPHNTGYTNESYPCDTTIRCTYCKSIVVGNSSHDIGEWTKYQNLTCTQNLTERAYCQRSTCSYFDERVTEYAKNHKFVSATCSSPLSCSKCDFFVETSELPHSFKEWQVVREANCNLNGERQRYCSVCNFKELDYINITNHIWGTPTVITPPTNIASGILEQICSICKTVKQTEIPKL